MIIKLTNMVQQDTDNVHAPPVNTTQDTVTRIRLEEILGVDDTERFLSGNFHTINYDNIFNTDYMRQETSNVLNTSDDSIPNAVTEVRRMINIMQVDDQLRQTMSGVLDLLSSELQNMDVQEYETPVDLITHIVPRITQAYTQQNEPTVPLHEDVD